MSDQDNIALVDAYLEGRLEGEDLERFEQRFRNEPELKALVEEVSALQVAAREIDLEDKLKLMRSWEDEASGGGRFFMRPWLAIAASVLLLVAAYFWWDLSEDAVYRKDLMALYEHQASDVLTRGGGVQDDRQKAFVMYEARRYGEALPYFESYIAQGEQKDSLFYSMALIGAERFEEGLTVLEALDLPAEPAWLPRYRIIALLGAGRVEEAQSIIGTLPSDQRVTYLNLIR